MAKKSINDPDFFDDVNLDDIGEAVEQLDPDIDGGGADDSVDADESVAEDDGGSEDDAAGDTPADDEPVADEPADGAPSDPAPHLEDLDTAKVAYAEIRKWANQRDMEARKLAEKIAELEAAQQHDPSFDYDDTTEYDTQAFAYMAAQDPRAAFRYAIDGGADSDAQAAIAKVQSDAQEVAAMAALAHRDGDQNAYTQLNQQAVNLNSLAQSMQGEFQGVQNQRAQAPLQEWQRNQNLAAAEQALAAQLPEYGARRDQVIGVLRQQPNLIAGHSVQEIHTGLRAAYAVAALEPVVQQQSVVPDIDSVVKEAVQKHIAATRKAKANAADAASGGDGARSAPSSSGGRASVKDDIYAAQAAASLGARKFMDL